VANTSLKTEGAAPVVNPTATNADLVTAELIIEVLGLGIVVAVPRIASVIAGQGEQWITQVTGRLSDRLAVMGKKSVARSATLLMWSAWAFNQLEDDATAQECVDFASAFLVGAAGPLAFKQKVSAGYDALVRDLADKKAKTQENADIRASLKQTSTSALLRMEAELEFVTRGVHTESDKARAQKIADAILAAIKS
jgi:hypothetical protein